MPKRFVDLSISIESNLPSDPLITRPEVEYVRHSQGADQMLEAFPGITKADLPDGQGWALEYLRICTHSGTHLDAPYHYHPWMDQGSRALTIDEIPLEWCFGNGVLLDFRHKADGDYINVKDLESALDNISYSIQPLDIVLIQTGADEFWGKPEYLVKGAGMGRESTLWLLDKGVRVVGIDAWSWDRPLPFIAADFKKNGDPRVIWEAHFAGIEKGYCHLEKLANLSAIGRSHGFTVFVSQSRSKGQAPAGPSLSLL